VGTVAVAAFQAGVGPSGPAPLMLTRSPSSLRARRRASGA
jgi:hypothetical protein